MFEYLLRKYLYEESYVLDQCLTILLTHQHQWQTHMSSFAPSMIKGVLLALLGLVEHAAPLGMEDHRSMNIYGMMLLLEL